MRDWFIQSSLFGKTTISCFTRRSELFVLAIVYTKYITNLRIRVIDTDPLTSTSEPSVPYGYFWQ